jgi:hypothetical protein
MYWNSSRTGRHANDNACAATRGGSKVKFCAQIFGPGLHIG